MGLLRYLSGGRSAPAVSPIRSVTEFNGTADETTDAFQVHEGWQLHWETTGEAFAFAITGDRNFGTVVRQEGPGSGITSPIGAGIFRLEIKAKGPWSVRIIQREQ